jgi:N-methylhydantoinase A
VREAFHQEHERRFSYASRDDVVEMVTLRLEAIGRLERPQLTADEDEVAAPTARRRPVWIGDGWRDVRVIRRETIGSGSRLDGPLIVEEDYTTLFVAPGWSLHRAAAGHLVADHAGILP